MSKFIDAFENKKRCTSTDASQAEIMRNFWARGNFWYIQAVQSQKALLRMFDGHLQRIFWEEHCILRVFNRVVSPYWCVGTEVLIQTRVEQEAEYKDRLRKRFGELHEISWSFESKNLISISITLCRFVVSTLLYAVMIRVGCGYIEAWFSYMMSLGY